MVYESSMYVAQPWRMSGAELTGINFTPLNKWRPKKEIKFSSRK